MAKYWGTLPFFPKMTQIGMKWILNTTLRNVTFWYAWPPHPRCNICYIFFSLDKNYLSFHKPFWKHNVSTIAASNASLKSRGTKGFTVYSPLRMAGSIGCVMEIKNQHHQYTPYPKWNESHYAVCFKVLLVTLLCSCVEQCDTFMKKTIFISSLRVNVLQCVRYIPNVEVNTLCNLRWIKDMSLFSQ